MKYKLIGNNDTRNIIKTVLNNRGIEDWKGYISLSKAPRDTYDNLDNIAKAVFAFDMHYVQKHPIAILVDNDVDGICSSTLMYITLTCPRCPVSVAKKISTTVYLLRCTFLFIAL